MPRSSSASLPTPMPASPTAFATSYTPSMSYTTWAIPCTTWRGCVIRIIRTGLMDREYTQKCVLHCTALSVVKILGSAEKSYNKSKPIGSHVEGQVVTIIRQMGARLWVELWLPCWRMIQRRFIPSILIPFICFVVGGCISVKDEQPELCVRKVNFCMNCCWIATDLCGSYHVTCALSILFFVELNNSHQSSVVVTGVTAYLPTGSKRIQQWSVVNMWLPLRILMRTRYSVKVPPINNDDDNIFPTACIPMVGKVAVAMLERNLMRLFIISIAPTANMKIDKRLHIRRINLLLGMGILFRFVLLWLRLQLWVC